MSETLFRSETITTFTMEGVQEVTLDAADSDSIGGPTVHLNFDTPTPAQGTDDFSTTATFFLQQWSQQRVLFVAHVHPTFQILQLHQYLVTYYSLCAFYKQSIFGFFCKDTTDIKVSFK